MDSIFRRKRLERLRKYNFANPFALNLDSMYVKMSFKFAENCFRRHNLKNTYTCESCHLSNNYNLPHIPTFLHKHVSVQRTFAVEPVSVEHVAVEQVAVEPVTVEHVSAEHVSVDDVAVEHVAVEHVEVEHVAVEHVAVAHLAVHRTCCSR
jgi:hypothetical protein